MSQSLEYWMIVYVCYVTDLQIYKQIKANLFSGHKNSLFK